MNVGVAFISTGGEKVLRAIRSLRRSEPDLPIHVLIDTASNTWKNLECGSLSLIEQQPGVEVKLYPNGLGYVNGMLNEAMRWLRDLGYEYACLFHDDIIFSPLPEHKGQLSIWFEKSELRESSAFSFSFLQAFIPGVWRRSSAEWGKTDLESESFWKLLLPEEYRSGYVLSEGGVYRLHFPEFFVQDCAVTKFYRCTNLGPTGQIVPISIWDSVGGFDERDGIFFDQQYPAECAVRELPPIWMIPNVPHLHLHNQSLIADPAIGLWSNTVAAFTKRYGRDPIAFWEEIKRTKGAF